jgi:hypothetical protein
VAVLAPFSASWEAPKWPSTTHRKAGPHPRDSFEMGRRGVAGTVGRDKIVSVMDINDPELDPRLAAQYDLDNPWGEDLDFF